MKISLRLVLFLAAALAVSGDLRAQPAPSADEAFAALEAMANPERPAEFPTMTMPERLRWMDGTMIRLSAAAEKFYAAHPTDPRRWQAAAMMMRIRPNFIKEIGADFDQVGEKAIVIDEAAVAAHKARLAEVQEAARRATDLPLPQGEFFAWMDFAGDVRAASARAKAGEAVDWSVFATRFDAHAAKYAALEPTVIQRAEEYLGGLARRAPEVAAAQWAHLEQDSPLPGLRRHIVAKREQEAARKQPQELAFTAVDGRPVDLAKLRGKVVLIDFWATWCGPCIAELPNVVANYQKYREHGFEVVGISLENGQLSANDTAEQKEAKLAKAKARLLAFAEKHQMPWPQYFDGKWWQNDIALRYGIKGIPAMLLLDQNGIVVTSDARGPKLEAEIKRLLKI